MSDERIQRAFEHLWKRLREEYPFGDMFEAMVFQKANEIWEKTSPYPTEYDEFKIDVEGKIFRGSLPAFVFITAIGETIKDILLDIYNSLPELSKEAFEEVKDGIIEEVKKKTLWELKHDLSGSIIFYKTCPDCGFKNPPTAKYCMECGYNFEVEEE